MLHILSSCSLLWAIHLLILQESKYKMITHRKVAEEKRKSRLHTRGARYHQPERLITFHMACHFKLYTNSCVISTSDIFGKNFQWMSCEEHLEKKVLKDNPQLAGFLNPKPIKVTAYLVISEWIGSNKALYHKKGLQGKPVFALQSSYVIFPCEVSSLSSMEWGDRNLAS